MKKLLREKEIALASIHDSSQSTTLLKKSNYIKVDHYKIEVRTIVSGVSYLLKAYITARITSWASIPPKSMMHIAYIPPISTKRFYLPPIYAKLFNFSYFSFNLSLLA